MNFGPRFPRLSAIFIPATLLVALAITPRLAHAAEGSTPYVWRNVPILGGGFVSGLVFHPTQRDLLYARTDVGGAYRWDSAQKLWLPLNDDLGRTNTQLTGVLSLALDPADPDRVYLLGGQYTRSAQPVAAVQSSTDRGATWHRTPLTFNLGGNEDGRSTGERLQVDPGDGAILLLGSSRDGLWRSADHAQTWTKVAGFPNASSSFTLVLFDPRSSGGRGQPAKTIYAGLNDATGPALFRSTDAGATWAAVPGQPPGLIPHHAALDANGVLFLTYGNGPGPNGVARGAVWKLNSASGIWTDVTPQPAGSGGFGGLALDPSHPGTLIVTTLDRWSPHDEIYRSTDGGATWAALYGQAAWDNSPAPWSRSMRPHWLGAIALDPFNSDRALFVTGYGVWETDNLTVADRGQPTRWVFRDEGLEETVPLALISPPDGPHLVSAIGDIDGFRWDDINAVPASRLLPSFGTNNFIAFAALKPAVMVRTFSGGRSTGGALSTDGGVTWRAFASAPGAAPVAGARGGGGGGGGAIALSADGTRIVWATRGGLWLSTDNGSTWQAVSGVSGGGGRGNGGGGGAPVADGVNPRRFYLLSGGTLFVSNDGGASFAATNAPGLPRGGAVLRVAPGLEGNLWLAAGDGLHRSTDGGATFVKLPGVQQASRVGFGQAAPGRSHPAVFIVGRVGGADGFFRSDDAGATWLRLNDDRHQFGGINDLAGDPRVFGRLYLATGGRGIIVGEPAPVH